MGEIRVKSENLVESFKNTEYTGQYRICLLGKLDIKPSTSYTISFIMEEGVKAYFNENIFSFISFTGTGQRQVLNITTIANIDKNISTWVDEYGWILCKNMVNNENPCNFREVMILEGTYTAQTIPSYQPYFLNLPAHEKTSTSWKNIPTHIMTATGWQGELTSQSPLEFRATGQSLLDWRIDGALGGVGDWDETTQRYKIPVRVEGENLFDINSDHTSIVWDGKECLVIENGAIVVNQIRPGYMTGIYYDKVYTPGIYTFTMKQLATQSGQTEIRIVSSAPFVGSNYNNSYKAYTAALTKQNNTHYITIVVMESTKIGFFINWYFSVNDKLYDIQLLEGTYAADTLPPYEVNLFTDHQLMDGDSIDYATDQTAIPIATGNNTLTVDTAVKPSKVFVKFEG